MDLSDFLIIRFIRLKYPIFTQLSYSLTETLIGEYVSNWQLFN